MTKLPVISGEECIKALQRLGYKMDRTHGSHVWMVCSERQPLPVPKHKELGHGILRKIKIFQPLYKFLLRNARKIISHF